MVIFEFAVDQNILLDDLSANPSKESLAVLQETYFVFPTRLNINGSEMLSISLKKLVMYGNQVGGELNFADQIIENPWMSLPLLHLVLVGFGQVRKACAGQVASYSLPGTGALLIFVPIQGNIEIRSTLTGRTESVECHELLEAFINFKNKALRFLIQSVPDIEKHSEWGKIINGG